MLRLPLLATAALLGLGSSAVTARELPESNVERLERRLLHYPLGHRYDLYRIQSFVGGAEGLRKRWEKKFVVAEGETREKWALLLALNAAPRHRESERDLGQARRWLEEAGQSFEAHNLRAVVASMANDPENATRHLQASFTARPSLAVLNQMLFVRHHVAGHAPGTEATMAFWQDAAQLPETTPELRLEILRQLSTIKCKAGQRARWMAELEDRFKSGPKNPTPWVEALALARLHLKGQSAENTWKWLEEARRAEAPARLYHMEWSALIRAYEGRESAGLTVAKLPRLQVPAESPREMIALLKDPPVGSATDAKEAAAAYLAKNAKVALSEPLVWLSLPLDPQHQLTPPLKEAILSLLRPHLAAHPDDLPARYTLGHLLYHSGERAESAKMIDALIRDAIPRRNESVDGPDYTSRRGVDSPFGLSFPSPRAEGQKDKKPAGTTIFSLQSSAPGEVRSPYPIAPLLNLETHIETVGDLILRGFVLLHQSDRDLFDKTFRHWVETTEPPLAVQIHLAEKVDRERRNKEIEPALTDALFEGVLARNKLTADEAAFLLSEWQFRLLPAERVRDLGAIYLAGYPDKRPALKSRQLRTLIANKRLVEAETLLDELQTLARPDNEADANHLRFLSGQLAKAAGRPGPIPPAPDRREKERKDKETAFQHWVTYFKGEQANSLPPSVTLGYYGRPPDWPFRLLVEQGHLLPGKPLDVMYHWGMSQIDASLSIGEIGFASLRWGLDIKEMTRPDFQRLVAEVGEDNLPLALVRAYYEGNPTPEEQLAAVENLSAKHPKNDRLRAVVAGKTLSMGRYRQAYEAASTISTKHGDLAWFAHGLMLLCALELKEEAKAITAARALMPLTLQKDHRAWLAEKLENLGLPAEAAKMREKPAFLNAG